MKTINFKIQKGGVGATSIGVSVAYQLATKGYKTLLIDADPQGNATNWTEKLFKDTPSFELSDIIDQYTKNPDTTDIYKGIVETINPNFFVLPSFSVNGTLSSVKESLVSKSIYFMSDLLEQLKDFFEYVIIDTAPAFNKFEQMIYCASDEVIPVLLLDGFSIEGYETFNSNVKLMKKENRITNPAVTKYILNRNNKSESVSKTTLDAFKDLLKDTKYFIVPQEQGFKKCQITKTMIQESKDIKLDTLEVIKDITQSIIE